MYAAWLLTCELSDIPNETDADSFGLIWDGKC